MLLAIDTATRVLSLALHDGEQVRAETTWITKNQHTTELMPAIRQLLDRSQVDMTDLTILAVSQGPGSFNGLRIGISAAKGLAMARNLPLLAIPTLDVIAAAQPGPLTAQGGTLIAVVQAGRGRVCAGRYQWRTGRWISQDDVKIVSWHTVVEVVEDAQVNGSETVISGEIDAEGRAAISQKTSLRVASPAFCLRRAGFLAELAWERWRAVDRDPQLGDAAAVAPIYLHQPGVPHA